MPESTRRRTRKANRAPKPVSSRPPDRAVVADHPIRSEQIHPNVHAICRRLSDHGHAAWLVGGAVRDLLLGRFPKDFDLATSARPEEVKRLFRNARIIGRRFRLVLVRYPYMSVEISTFRTQPGRKKNGMIWRDNRFGTLEEDVVRRDFTINALTLDPIELVLLDHVGAMEDLKAGRIRTIKPPGESYQEDPVRMLRAVRFKSRLDLEIEPECEAAIPGLAHLLNQVSRHRLADELQRLLTSGHAEDMCWHLERLGLLEHLLHREPFPWFFESDHQQGVLDELRPLLRCLDAWPAQQAEPVPPTVALLALLVTLGPRSLPRFLLGQPPRKGSRVSGLDPRLDSMFAKWGLLNGQVGPAIAILKAGRLAVMDGAQKNGDSTPAPPPPGIREAWLLLAVLQDVLGLDSKLIARGMSQLFRLPDLPILDHPRPPRHRRGESDFPRKKRTGRKKNRGRRTSPGRHARTGD